MTAVICNDTYMTDQAWKWMLQQAAYQKTVRINIEIHGLNIEIHV